MPTFTAADGHAAAQQLGAEQQAIFESIIDLEEHLGRTLLDNMVLEGVSRERRVEVLDGFATLWTRYESYRITVVRVSAIMARSRPTQDDLRAVEELVANAKDLAAGIRAVHRRIHAVLTAADEVCTKLTPRIDRCDTLLRQAASLAADLGLAADQDPAAGVLSRLADRLDTVRRTVLTDPLRLWADGVVAVGEADQLIAQCEQAHAGLHALSELRQHAPGRLDRVGTALTEVDRLDQEIAAERRRVNAKILVASAQVTRVQPAGSLGSRLPAAWELYRGGNWRRLATELPDLEREAAAALQRAQAGLIEAGRPLRERAELRGRLGAYRAKAAGLGRIEDLALDAQYQRARELLWCAPCDLTAAAAAVAQYQDAVNAMVKRGELA